MRLDVPLFTQTSDFSCGSAAVRTQIVEFGNDYHFKTLYQGIEEKNRNSRLYVERFGSLGLIFMAIIGCFVLIILLFQIFSASQAEHWETEVEGTKPWSYDLGANSTTSQRWEFPTSDRW